MTKNAKNTLSSAVAKVTSKSLYSMAELFAGMTCIGRCYEPKMPDKLKK